MSETLFPGISILPNCEGEMASLIKSFDWSKTSIGAYDSWPHTLKAYVSMMLAQPNPCSIFWGDDFIQIYNQSCISTMGDRHPSNLGLSIKIGWPEAYAMSESFFRRIKENGEVVVFNRAFTPLDRHGFIEECYFDSILSPLKDDDGRRQGILVHIANENTDSVLSDRRTALLRSMSQVTITPHNVNNLMDLFATNPNDIRFSYLFLTDESNSHINLAASFGIDENNTQSAGFTELKKMVQESLTTKNMLEINDFQKIIPHAPIAPWPEPTRKVILIPIFTDSNPAKGVLVFGISPRLNFNEAYRGFLTDIALRLAGFLESDAQSRDAIKIHKSYQFLNSVIDHVPLMIFVKDAKDLRFTRFNKAGEELLGYSSKDLIGKNDYDFFNKAEADFFIEKDRAALASGKVLNIPEEKIQTRLKGERCLHTKKITLYDEHGQPEFLLGISEDITDMKVAEEQRHLLLQEQAARNEAEKMIQQRDDFISIAAHELRTPLTSISLQNQLINKLLPSVEGPATPKLKSLTDNCQTQIERLSKLVENLLDVTRATTGRLVLDRSQVDLSELVEAIAKGFEGQIAKSKCTLSLNLTPSIKGNWDSPRIEQVLVNLLSNAIKFGAGKPIEITTEIKDSQAILKVKDHGIGISQEDQARLFNRFERAVSITSFGGLGLGLFISRQIAAAHGGNVRVESQLGKGSTFILELPL